MYNKIKKIFDKKDVFIVIDNDVDGVSINEKGDLLSICIIYDCRGSGLAQNMIEKLEKILRDKGRKICILTVEPKNKRAVHFYEKNCYKAYKKVLTAVTYAKMIGG